MDTISKIELIALIAHLPDNAELALGVDYGDRVNTVQAVGFEMGLEKAYVVESDYSTTGYKLVNKETAERELDGDASGVEVWVLNPSSISDISDGDDDDEDEDEF